MKPTFKHWFCYDKYGSGLMSSCLLCRNIKCCLYKVLVNFWHKLRLLVENFKIQTLAIKISENASFWELLTELVPVNSWLTLKNTLLKFSTLSKLMKIINFCSWKKLFGLTLNEIVKVEISTSRSPLIFVTGQRNTYHWNHNIQQDI